MSWKALVLLLGWTILCLVIAFAALFFFLMGDCPENVIGPGSWGHHCTDTKRLAAVSLLGGGPLLWLVVGFIIVRRWSRK